MNKIYNSKFCYTAILIEGKSRRKRYEHGSFIDSLRNENYLKVYILLVKIADGNHLSGTQHRLKVSGNKKTINLTSALCSLPFNNNLCSQIKKKRYIYQINAKDK